MNVRVRFVFNKNTGEVEEFVIDDVGSRLSQADHDREHDRVSAEIARVVDRNPRVSQAPRDGFVPAPEPQDQVSDPTQEPAGRTRRQDRNG